MKEGFKEVIHFECGKPAFLAVDIKWDTMTAVNADRIAHLKGDDKFINDVTPLMCETCEEAINTIELTFDNHIIAISTNEGLRDYYEQLDELKKDLK